MSKAWAWITGKLWPVVKAHWKVIAAFALGILAVWAGRKVITVVHDRVEAFLVPKVLSPLPFVVIDASHVAVQTPHGAQVVDTQEELGKPASEVLAVGEAAGGKVAVQVRNPPLG